jgi:hypothetical protein
MNELRDWLKDGDPIAHEPPLSPADVGQMRRAIVAAEASNRSSLADWARGSWAVATIVVALTIAVSMSRWVTPWSYVGDADANVDAAPTVALPEPRARRQVQLIAPGGTRVIWIFNDDFKP